MACVAMGQLWRENDFGQITTLHVFWPFCEVILRFGAFEMLKNKKCLPCEAYEICWQGQQTSFDRYSWFEKFDKINYELNFLLCVVIKICVEYVNV